MACANFQNKHIGTSKRTFFACGEKPFVSQPYSTQQSIVDDKHCSFSGSYSATVNVLSKRQSNLVHNSELEWWYQGPISQDLERSSGQIPIPLPFRLKGTMKPFIADVPQTVDCHLRSALATLCCAAVLTCVPREKCSKLPTLLSSNGRITMSCISTKLWFAATFTSRNTRKTFTNSDFSENPGKNNSQTSPLLATDWKIAAPAPLNLRDGQSSCKGLQPRMR